MYMGRNYFSKHGGPYFKNDGFSHHIPNQNKEYIKPSPNLFYGLTIVFLSLILTIGILLVVVS